MERRSFLKMCGVALVSPVVFAKSSFVKATPEEINSFICRGPNYALYEGIWFFCDSNLIQFRAKTNKGLWNCMSIPKFEMFKRWKHWKGKLYLYSMNNVYEILANPVRIQLLGAGWVNLP